MARLSHARATSRTRARHRPASRGLMLERYGVQTQPGMASHCCSVMPLHVPNGCPEQFACQKQPEVPEHDVNAVRAPHASPVVDAVPIQVPKSWHPVTSGQTAPESPPQAIGVPLHVPCATKNPELPFAGPVLHAGTKTNAPMAKAASSARTTGIRSFWGCTPVSASLRVSYALRTSASARRCLAPSPRYDVPCMQASSLGSKAARRSSVARVAGLCA